MFVNYFPESVCDFGNSLIPGNPLKAVPHPLERVQQSVGMVLVVGDAEAFTAGIALAPWIGLVGPNLDDPVLFHLNLQATIRETQTTTRLFPGHKSNLQVTTRRRP
jgi:hypothetical protein